MRQIDICILLIASNVHVNFSVTVRRTYVNDLCNKSKEYLDHSERVTTGRSSSQDVIKLLTGSEVSFCKLKFYPTDLVLSQMNPDHFHIVIFLPSTLGVTFSD
jgi:hypothetical protein